MKGVGCLADPLPYHFPQGEYRYHVSLSGHSAMAILYYHSYFIWR